MRRLLLLLSVVPFTSCVDPVHDEQVEDQGPEAAGVPEGPLHRPGDWCTACHSERGPGEPQWSVAGTIFMAWNSEVGAQGAVVKLTDANKKEKLLTANEAGNFYVAKDEYDPVYPLSVEVAFNGKTQKMETKIGRDAGCGRCHRFLGDRSHAARVFVPGGGPTP